MFDQQKRADYDTRENGITCELARFFMGRAFFDGRLK